jgi:hypothetical protein
MTNQVTRLYMVVAGVLVFFVAWVAIAAHPWVTRPTVDPRLAALAAREQRLRHESIVVKRLVEQRWATYRVHLRARRHAIAAIRAQRGRAAAAALASAPVAAASAPPVATAPAVRVVTLPPLVVTRTS